jgi:hypothetical protein
MQFRKITATSSGNHINTLWAKCIIIEKVTATCKLSLYLKILNEYKRFVVIYTYWFTTFAHDLITVQFFKLQAKKFNFVLHVRLYKTRSNIEKALSPS